MKWLEIGTFYLRQSSSTGQLRDFRYLTPGHDYQSREEDSTSLRVRFIRGSISKQIVVSYRFHIATHSQIFWRLGDGVSQPNGICNLHVSRNIEDFLHFFLYGLAVKHAHHLKADLQRFGHEPHVLHDAAQAQYTEEVTLGGWCPLS